MTRKLFCRLGIHRNRLLNIAPKTIYKQHLSWKIDIEISLRCKDCSKQIVRTTKTITDGDLEFYLNEVYDKATEMYQNWDLSI